VASFLLTPCKIREGWLVPRKDGETLSLSWSELCARLAPSGTLLAKQNLRKAAAPNAYAILVRQPSGVVSNVLLRNSNLSGDIRAVVQRDPTFEGRVVEAFRFEQVSWDDAVVEPGSTR
jgi:hypothetical protein